MKFIALISGGKDSTFAIHECQRQGHELVALANLYPLEEEEGEGPPDDDARGPDAAGDLDSWCFQTVGHGLVRSYVRCVPLGVPLYRRATRGAARRKGLSYPPSRLTPGDEVEDLAALLAFIVERHSHRAADASPQFPQPPPPPPPPPLGVCSGAVASDYQRLRVEAVACGRLGLVSLAPLWRRAQYPLLRAMDRAGVRAVVAKVAAAGLDPRRDLGRDVACLATRRRLAALRATYGLNVCGEGGEYETLTLDAPAGVFPRGRVVLGGEAGLVGAAAEGGGSGGGDDGDEEKEAARRRGWRLVITSEDAVAPGGALVPVSFRVVPRDGSGWDTATEPEGEVVEVPRAYEAPLPPPPPAAAAAEGGDDNEDGEKNDGPGLRARVSVRASERHAVVGCRVMMTPVGDDETRAAAAAAAEGAEAPEAAATTARAVRVALRAVERAAAEELLRRRSPSSSSAVWPRALFVHLLLRDMRHFAAANAAYCSVVPLLRPPARACVEAPLPPGCLLHVDALVLLPPSSSSSSSSSGAEKIQASPAANEDDQDDQDDDGAGGEAAQARLGRRVLHVQSVSPWAPACIGPYGQAAADGRGVLLHLAGQIPLDPASMELLGSAAAIAEEEKEADEAPAKGGGGSPPRPSSATVLRHTDRVLRSCQAVAVAAGGRMDGRGCAGAAVYLSPGGGARAGTAAAAVAAFLREGRTAASAANEEEDGDEGKEEEDDEDEDDYVDEYLRPLDVPRGRVRVDQRSWVVGGGGGGPGEEEEDDEGAGADDQVSACLYAVVPCLPRGSLVEVQPTLLDLRAFAPGGGAGEPPSSSSSSSSEDEGEEEGGEDGGGDRAAAAAELPADEIAALAASTGATVHLRAYSWLARQAPGTGRRRRRQQPQRRLAARLLVALPLESIKEGHGGSGGSFCRGAAAAVAAALEEARPRLACPGRASAPNVVSVRAWCTPEAYAELAGSGGGGEDCLPSSPFDAALLAAARLGGPAGAQVLPALEVRCSDPAARGDGLSPPCAAVVELMVLH